jgi:hypothetical protein
VLRPLRGVFVLFAVVLLAACTTPATGDDDYTVGSRVVAQLVHDAATSAATGASIDRPTHGPVTCRRRVLGFAAGDAGSRKVESAESIDLPDDAPVRPMLERIANNWRSEGYDVDDAAIDDERFPKVSARVRNGYEVVATRLLAQHQLELYAVSRCLRGD